MRYHAELRTITLSGEIDTEAADHVITSLLELEKNDPNQPITLVINSGGGYLDDALAIFDAIKQCDCTVVGLVLGSCFSAAGLVLQACDARLMSKHSYFMIHEGTVKIPRQHPEEVEQRSRFSARMRKAIYKIFSEASGKPVRELERISRFSKYFSADEAVKNGFADKVIPQK